MTELSRQILARWQIRKTKKQKSDFIAFLQKELGEENVRVEQAGTFRSRNIVIGNIDEAEFILAAHYDTQPVLPFPNFLPPKNMPLYIGYSLLLVLGIFALEFLLGFVLAWLNVPGGLAFGIAYGVLLVLMGLMFFGPANKHTANDNTSGVIAVLEAYADESIRSRAAFVLFDHEEMGLLGSAAFAKAHKKKLKNKLLINMDCVGDGDTVMVILSKRAKHLRASMEEAFLPTEKKNALITDAGHTFYPSDQMNVPVSAGVAAFRRAPVVGYYVSRIHTPKDTVMEEENIAFILDGIRRFTA